MNQDNLIGFNYQIYAILLLQLYYETFKIRIFNFNLNIFNLIIY